MNKRVAILSPEITEIDTRYDIFGNRKGDPWFGK